jgi:hypothetical protein
MPHSYKSEYPSGVQIDDGIKAFFEEFYKTSDTPDVHEKYADNFTKDATLIMASKKGVGREGNSYFLRCQLVIAFPPVLSPRRIVSRGVQGYKFGHDICWT